jgi:hypothetical protein
MAHQNDFQRVVFEKFNISGFPSLKVDTLAVTAGVGQHQVLLRTTDGLLVPLDCTPPSSMWYNQCCVYFVVFLPSQLNSNKKDEASSQVSSSFYSTESSAVYQCKVSADKAQHPRPKDKKLVAALQIIEVIKLHSSYFQAIEVYLSTELQYYVLQLLVILS